MKKFDEGVFWETLNRLTTTRVNFAEVEEALGAALGKKRPKPYEVWEYVCRDEAVPEYWLAVDMKRPGEERVPFYPGGIGWVRLDKPSISDVPQNLPLDKMRYVAEGPSEWMHP